ncbi:hypothetical protein IKE83_02025 [Candidatus Saccharibacteria bacterium]|nr:hypothetical protein [Candidatus Saccharibacteria bacterium]
MGYADRTLDAFDIALRNHKEPFDFAKFARYYAHDTGDAEPLSRHSSDSTKRHYARMYYLDYPNISTVDDFIDLMNRLDSQV